MWPKLFLTGLLLFGAGTSIHAERTDYGTIRVDTTPTQNERELIERADLIVLGWIDSAHQRYPTGLRVPSGSLFNFVQTIHVKQAMKGKPTHLLHLLTTGIEPLPDADDPLNLRYPGPLAEGDYVCFLRRVAGTTLYTIVGVWQGVYPIHQGRTVAIEGAGYPSFDKLSPQKMANKLKQLMKPR
jgi:hypothetical protein